MLVGREARIHRGARGADRGAQLVGKREEELEILGAAQRPPAGHDAPSRTAGRGGPALAAETRHEAGVRGQRDGRRQRLDAARPAARRRLEGGRAHGADELLGRRSTSTVTMALPA